MTVERQALAGIKWTAAAKLISQLFSWAATLVVMRLLVPADYGLLAMATVVVSLASTVAELGLGSSIVQARHLPDDELARVAGVVVALNLAIGVLLALASPVVAWAFGEPRLLALVPVMALQFAFNAASSVPQALMARDLMFKLSARIELAGALTSSAATLALALMGAGVWSLVLGSLFGVALRSALVMFLGVNVRPDFSFQGVRQHVRYGGGMTLARMGWETILQTDIMVASRHLGQTAIGAYSVGLHLATLPMQKIMMVVNQVAFATVARLQDEPQRLRAGLLKAFRLATLFSVPLLWGLAACAPEFIRVVLGPNWEAAIFPVQVLSVVIPLRLVSGVMWTAVTAVGRVDVFIRVVVVAAVVFPACFLIGVQWGLDGLALSWPVAWLLSFAIGLRGLMKPLQLDLPSILRATVVPVVAGLPMVAAIAATRALNAGLATSLRLALLVTVGALVYLTFVTLLDRSIWTDLRRSAAGAKG